VSEKLHRLTTTKYGEFLYNPKDVYVGRAMELYGEAHEHELELLRQLCGPGSCVFDVGANIGDHTVPLALHVGERGFVYAFEPQRIVFQNLCANVALNSLSNVECVQAALGAERGTVLIPEIDYSVEDNYGGVEVSKFAHGRPVPKVMLDDFTGISHLELMKIDVEGMEVETLLGGRQLLAKFRPVLYVENDRVDRSPSLIETLRELGFRMFWHLAPLFNERNFRGNPQNAFPNVVATNMLCIPAEVPFQVDGPGFTEVTDAGFHPFA
jgi:FkbM family methyltransferase